MKMMEGHRRKREREREGGGRRRRRRRRSCIIKSPPNISKATHLEKSDSAPVFKEIKKDLILSFILPHSLLLY